MTFCMWLVATTMFLTPADGEQKNPWKDKVVKAVHDAEAGGSVDAIASALDVAWRADNWEAGLKMVRLAQAKHASAPKLVGLITRALWRSGLLLEAEKTAAGITIETADRVGLVTLINISMARGEFAQAGKAADKLASFTDPTAEELTHIMAVRMAQDRLDNLEALVAKAVKLVDPKNGYPETHFAEELEGLPEFLRHVGDKPLNQIKTYGAAEMRPIPLIGLPGCDVMINGRGPYRMIVDTGGSITLSIDTAVAEEIGVKSIVESSVRGVSGKDVASQALVDELRIGDIVCTRVMTRVFGVRKAAAYSCDGIIGTGMFDRARMTLDFGTSRLVVAPSSAEPAKGKEVTLRIIGDGKLIAPVTIQGETAAGLLDSGADVAALSPSRLKKLFPDQKVHVMRVPMAGVGAEEGPGLSLSRGVDLVFAGRSLTNFSGLGLDVLDSILSTFLGVQSDVLIGMSVFREMRSLTVDFAKRKMWIEWLEP